MHRCPLIRVHGESRLVWCLFGVDAPRKNIVVYLLDGSIVVSFGDCFRKPALALPSLEVLKPFSQEVEIDRVWRV